ncbi:uncharacterized protein KD926_001960 [Aspergillus affinis]|uniref:uncharacterized protein n=1 Tax=Aspergillus affinis TaxID=1070780 RepID=UPI0022FE7FFC|nr:uncharacterized protein KD926_001960 [Aspergillus affinis]KAI9044136.1 hypothetical protein KD926_001960 [Aspergillus affinis]
MHKKANTANIVCIAGAEREMKVCHTQPQLVPPMKLADDPPSLSRPSWVVDGRNLASRASSRASMSFRRKSMATTSLRISAPSEFRRVPTFSMTPERASFRPLELSLGHLPELPNFEDFHLDDDQSRSPAPVARPPRAELSRHSRSRSHHLSSSFHLQRKPVGSGSLRSSLAPFDHLIQTPPPIPSNSHVPQLSSSSTVTGLTSNNFTPPQLDPTPPVKEESSRDPPSELPSVPRTPTLQDRPLTSFLVDDSSSAPSTPREAYPPRTPSENTTSPNVNTTTPPRSSRVTQWLLQTSNKSMFSPSGSVTSWKPTPDKNPFRLRSRTLSGSTVASSISSLTGSLGFKNTAPSESDNMTTTTTTIRPSNMDSRLAKDLEFPLPVTNTDEHQTQNHNLNHNAYPTINESQDQQKQQDDELFPYNYYENYRHSAVGLAF